MEAEKRSRSRSKTKEKERSKDDSKTRRSVEKNNETKKRDKSKQKEEKKPSKTISSQSEVAMKQKNDKLAEDSSAKKKAKESSNKEKKTKKSENGEEGEKTKKKQESSEKKENIEKVSQANSSLSKKGTVKDNTPSKAKRPVTPAKPEEEYNYDDDFEEYEEDFEVDEDEEESESEKKEKESKEIGTLPSMAVDKNSARSDRSDHSEVSTSRAATAASERSVERRPRTIQSRINFKQAHVTEAQMINYSRVRSRAKDLLQLIQLDTVSYDLFDMAPVRDYEFFMQNFGKSNMVQVQVQTGDDRIDREDQTEVLDLENKWTQHPPTDIFGCGGDQVNKDENAKTLKFDSEILNSVQFRRFVERGGTLISDLIADEFVSQEPAFQTKSSLSFSSGCSTVGIGPIAQKCNVTTVAFADCQSTILAVSFFIEESLLEDLIGKTLITVWNITHLDIPYKLLICDGRCQACCFSPDRVGAVFAGLNDSSVVAWDLQESESLHIDVIPWKDGDIVLRKPTYDTAFLCKEFSTEASPVVSVAALNPSPNATGKTAVDSYQLLSLHGDGSIRIWTALTTTSREPSELDLGLRPGGRLKLVLSAMLKPPLASLRNIKGIFMLKSNDIGAFCLGWAQDRQSDFYIGTDVGYVLRLTRHEGKSGPSIYQPYLEALTDVLCISFSPFESSVLLAGCSDGIIRLYKTSYGRPLTAFSLWSALNGPGAAPAPVRCLQWSPISPYRFYSLHGQSTLLTWDLKQNRQGPISSEQYSKPAVTFQISASVAFGSGPANFMGILLQDGTVEIHQMLAECGKTRYTTSDGAKLLKLVEML